MLKIYIDGATIGRNGKLGTVSEVGLGMYIPSLNFGDSERTNGISNNEAEFKALLWAMETATGLGIKKAHFLSDSKIIINRANGKRPTKAKWKNERMDAFQDKVFELRRSFDEIYFSWIPREKNTTADYYSDMAKNDKSLKTIKNIQKWKK